MAPTYHDDDFYPWRRLAAAMIKQAVHDVLGTEKRTPRHARHSAREFLADEDVRTVFGAALSIPEAVWSIPEE